MSSISSLEAELSRQKAINRELRSQLSEIESGVLAGYNALEACNQQICQTLNASAEKLASSHQTGLDAIATQQEIDVLYTRFKQMELANKKIRECNNKKYYEFSNYRTVRKQMQAIMDNLDLNMVSDRIIYKSVEKEHLMRPDYWLTCVMIAIMAWRSDDKPLADRALAQAIKLDKKSTSICLMLFNIRMQRNAAALKWFFTYQECSLKGSDQRTFLMLFALLSRTVSRSEDIDDETREEIQSFIQRVVNASMESDGYSQEEMVARALACYNRMNSREEPAYPYLKTYCTSFPQLAQAMGMAQGNLQILQFVKNVVHVDELQRNTYISRFMDELITEANDAEKEVYQEIRYNEMVIDCKGDVEQAKARFNAEQKHDETQLNLVAEMLHWIFAGDEEEVNPQSRLNMFTLTKEIQQQAIQAHTNAYRSVEKNTLPVVIQDYSASVNFSDEEGTRQNISTFYCAKRDQALAAIKDWPAYIAFAVAAASLGAAAFVNPLLLILTLAGIGAGIVTLLTNRSQRSACQLQCDNSIQAVAEIMHCLFEDHRKYLEELDHYDAYTTPLEAEFADL